MDTKATAPAPMYPQAGMADAPPSYEASVGPQPNYGPAQGAGGFAVPNPKAGPQGDPAGMQQHVGQQPPVNVGQPVIVQYVNAPSFGPHPVQMICHHCQCQITTSTDSEPGPMAWILAGVLCLVGMWPCACIPCCIDSLNSVTHKCPNCKNFLGRYKGGF